jgi:hypothetical protein
MCAATFILGFMPFKFFDYVMMFSAFLVIHVTYFGLFQFTSYEATRFLLVLAVLIFAAKEKLKSIEGNTFHIWLNYIIVLFIHTFAEFCFDRFVRKIGYLFNERIFMKMGVWGVSSLLIALLSALIIFYLKRWCFGYFNEINEMGKKYHSIERRFITISVGVLLVYIAGQDIVYRFFGYETAAVLLLKIVYFFSLFFQLLFLTLMYRLSHLRESLRSKEIENQSLLLYSSDLEKNFSEIRNIKHDIKNLFFTMGQYVQRSEDTEFKDFYRTKIFPFAEGEIKKNDLYGKLMLIENEQLRAFLYYKLTQAVELGIKVNVEIQEYTSSLSMEFGDIVRILGILIDNSLEESLTLKQNEGEIFLSFTNNSEAISIKIQNNVTARKLSEGIKPEVSEKGEGRGRGLKIANEIISRYDFAALNSYFQNGRFTQNLMIYRA